MFLLQHDEAGISSKVPLSGEEMHIADTENTEATVRPNSNVNIAFQVQGRRSWQKYEVCIAAVDKGIPFVDGFSERLIHTITSIASAELKTRSFDLYSGIFT